MLHTLAIKSLLYVACSYIEISSLLLMLDDSNSLLGYINGPCSQLFYKQGDKPVAYAFCAYSTLKEFFYKWSIQICNARQHPWKRASLIRFMFTFWSSHSVFPVCSSVAVYLPIYYVPQEQLTSDAVQLYFSILSIYNYYMWYLLFSIKQRIQKSVFGESFALFHISWQKAKNLKRKMLN